MELCQYENINNEKKNILTPFMKQLFVSSCVWAQFFLNGLWFGAPTVVIPQLRKAGNSTAVVNDEMESWLSSAFSYSTLPWAVIFPLCIRCWGRKVPFIFTSCVALISFILLYYSTSVLQILVSEIVGGLLIASNISIGMIVVTEYASPQYRGVFLCMKSASFNIAIWVANAIGTFFQWKFIAILGIVCSTFTLGAVFWPESPYWLASKGRYEECATKHRWLKGTDNEAEKELRNIIESHKKQYSEHDPLLKETFLARFCQIISSKTFYKPTLLSMLTMTLYHLSGKMVCTVYAIQMIKKVSQSESTAYIGMLILDGITILGMYSGCAVSRILKRRTLLLATSLSGALFLYALSIYLYLVKLSIIHENSITSLFLLTAFSLSISCGPLVMATSIYAELIPLTDKTLSMIITILFTAILQSTLLKVAPDLFKTCGMHGTFLFFGVSFSICIFLFYKFMPETKDKTLREIEDYFKGVSGI